MAIEVVAVVDEDLGPGEGLFRETSVEGLEFLDATLLFFALEAEILRLAVSFGELIFDVGNFFLHKVQPTSAVFVFLHEILQLARGDLFGSLDLGR